jgi:peptidoglycan hydrolase CwlO-like protein
MTPTDPILSPEQVQVIGGEIDTLWMLNGQSADKLLNSHEQLRARVAALEAERDNAQNDYDKLLKSSQGAAMDAAVEAKAREASAYTRGRESVLAIARECVYASEVFERADPPTRVPPGATPR